MSSINISVTNSSFTDRQASTNPSDATLGAAAFGYKGENSTDITLPGTFTAPGASSIKAERTGGAEETPNAQGVQPGVKTEPSDFDKRLEAKTKELKDQDLAKQALNLNATAAQNLQQNNLIIANQQNNAVTGTSGINAGNLLTISPTAIETAQANANAGQSMQEHPKFAQAKLEGFQPNVNEASLNMV